MNFTMGDYDRAELMYHDALEYWQSGGNLAWAAELLNNLGVLQQLRGDYEPAAKSFEKAVDYAKISNSAQSEGLSLASPVSYTHLPVHFPAQGCLFALF